MQVELPYRKPQSHNDQFVRIVDKKEQENSSWSSNANAFFFKLAELLAMLVAAVCRSRGRRGHGEG
jgi:hypothetical protein